MKGALKVEMGTSSAAAAEDAGLPTASVDANRALGHWHLVRAVVVPVMVDVVSSSGANPAAAEAERRQLIVGRCRRSRDSGCIGIILSNNWARGYGVCGCSLARSFVRCAGCVLLRVISSVRQYLEKLPWGTQLSTRVPPPPCPELRG